MARIESKEIATPELTADFPQSPEGHIPGLTHVYHPIGIHQSLIDKNIKKEIYARDTIKLGVLADRGYVYQLMGGIKNVQVEVADFPDSPFKICQIRAATILDKKTVEFLSEYSILLEGDEHGDITKNDVQEWFSKATTLRQRFLENVETQQLIQLRFEESSRTLSKEGIDEIWYKVGLPPARIRRSSGNVQIHYPSKYSLPKKLDMLLFSGGK